MISTNVAIILAGAILTYATRIGGHVILSRFSRIHPRVESGLDAVPAAVLTAIVAPAAITGGTPELAALAIAAVVALRFSLMSMFIAGALVVILLRNLL